MNSFHRECSQGRAEMHGHEVACLPGEAGLHMGQSQRRASPFLAKSVLSAYFPTGLGGAYAVSVAPMALVLPAITSCEWFVRPHLRCASRCATVLAVLEARQSNRQWCHRRRAVSRCGTSPESTIVAPSGHDRPGDDEHRMLSTNPPVHVGPFDRRDSACRHREVIRLHNSIPTGIHRRACAIVHDP